MRMETEQCLCFISFMGLCLVCECCVSTANRRSGPRPSSYRFWEEQLYDQFESASQRFLDQCTQWLLIAESRHDRQAAQNADQLSQSDWDEIKTDLPPAACRRSQRMVPVCHKEYGPAISWDSAQMQCSSMPAKLQNMDRPAVPNATVCEECVWRHWDCAVSCSTNAASWMHLPLIGHTWFVIAIDVPVHQRCRAISSDSDRLSLTTVTSFLNSNINIVPRSILSCCCSNAEAFS